MCSTRLPFLFRHSLLAIAFAWDLLRLCHSLFLRGTKLRSHKSLQFKLLSCACMFLHSRLIAAQLPLSPWSCQRLLSSLSSSLQVVLQLHSIDSTTAASHESPRFRARCVLAPFTPVLRLELRFVAFMTPPSCRQHNPRRSRANHLHHDHIFPRRTSKLQRHHDPNMCFSTSCHRTNCRHSFVLSSTLSEGRDPTLHDRVVATLCAFLWLHRNRVLVLASQNCS